MRRRFPLVLLSLALIAFPESSRADEHWPKPAEERFQEALKTGLAGDHKKAAELYRTVADWPEGGEFRERARALHAAGAELEAARDLEGALAAYREVLARFPKSDFAPVAKRAADKLADVEFERRHLEAWDVLLPAMSLSDKRDFEGARTGLEKALALLEALLRDRRDHPRAVDVAIARSDVLVRLGRLDEAREAAEDALALASREGGKPGASTAARAFVVSAQRQLGEARAAIWAWRLGVTAKVVLVALAVFLVASRPDRALGRRHGKLFLWLVAGDGALAGIAVFAARRAQRLQQDPPLVTDGMAAALEFFPALAGLTVALATAASYKGRRGAALAALCGVASALAVSVCLAERLGLASVFVPGGS